MAVADVVNDANARLHSFTGVTEQMSTLTSAMSPTSATFSVKHPDRINRGLVEIDDELLYVTDNDQTVCTVEAWGRGQQGSVATDHAAGAKVTNDPLFPRHGVREALNRAALRVSGELFRVQAYEGVPDLLSGKLVLPWSDVMRVRSVEMIDPYGSCREPVRSWSFLPSEFGTPTVRTNVPPSWSVQVVGELPLGTATRNSDDETLLGWTGRVRDVLVLGAMYDLLQTLESARLQMQSVNSQMLADRVPAGAATNASKAVLAQYLQALAMAKKALNEQHRSYTHWRA